LQQLFRRRDLADHVLVLPVVFDERLNLGQRFRMAPERGGFALDGRVGHLRHQLVVLGLYGSEFVKHSWSLIASQTLLPGDSLNSSRPSHCLMCAGFHPKRSYALRATAFGLAMPLRGTD